jgi:hypothetical protein
MNEKFWYSTVTQKSSLLVEIIDLWTDPLIDGKINLNIFLTQFLTIITTSILPSNLYSTILRNEGPGREVFHSPLQEKPTFSSEPADVLAYK